ncbi:Willebrand factor type A domain-containing AAA ATPase [Encephalitozoon intestinalis ATCC 50506]|uniref:Midasin n=1 Tax=Encephalitozoon intestinalis (strain ATCC 50506) TaxID=876142 RepID=E0S8B1_ENCIT|nr:Willebrand factor type A domain-containing AAA ATPase [Encephalitozoon intestinalis ATCC 50506]ADM12117.1 Willebrand factor type A domain-containing AAA ATPase [Encephalitozoon intestinalis ATCC 50506]UTX45910.1 midasin [Encephalitozoon intestinalis]
MKHKKQKTGEARVGSLEKFERLAREAVDLKVPVGVYGEVGRSSLVSRLHSGIYSKGGRLVEIDSREITDARTLGGFYAVKEGDVEYMKGLLIESMERGDWVLFKRIDKNHGLMQYLFTVVKYRRLLGNDGREVLAHEDFRIFFTSNDILDMDDIVFVGPLGFMFEEAMMMFEIACVRQLLMKVFEVISTHWKGCSKEKGEECQRSCLKIACKNNGWCLFKESTVCGAHFRSLQRIKKRLEGSNGTKTEERVKVYQSVCNVLLRHDSDSLRYLLALTDIPDISLHGLDFAKTSSVEWGIFNLLWNIKNRDHTLLIGDTGVGKTSMIQYLSSKSHFFLGVATKLRVVNMSADFDGTDLIGGYGTLDINKAIERICNQERLSTPVCYGNKEKLEYLREKLSLRKEDGLKHEGAIKKIDDLLKLLEKKVHFVYKKGILTECMENGEWLLLDEINLSSEETLDLIDGVLGKKEILLYESGDLRPLEIHPGFMLFGCMNPGGDFGKKKYEGVEFNSVHIHDFSTSLKDINLVIHSVLKYEISEERKSKIGEFFLELKNKVRKGELGNIVEPLISGRSLVRVLNFIRRRAEKGFEQSVWEGFDLFVFTQLDFVSRSIAISLLSKYFATQSLSVERTKVKDGFVLTHRIQTYLRIMELGVLSNCPLLLQGDTSTGKTSMVLFLSKEMNKRVIRINNHEHTEASDYIGSFTCTSRGVEFQEGVLVTAMRRGYWVILDELNLASSDVLEVLNRLLDDNKQIYIPEIDEVVVPHENFRVFATQNIGYGGRKGLSKAFRNRFVEMFFNEGGEEEILEILHGGSGLPKSFCKKMVEVYSGLRSKRSVNALVTLRDLFKWSGRVPRSLSEVCFLGMSIIYERQREEKDRRWVFQVFSESFGEVEVERYGRIITGKEDKEEIVIGKKGTNLKDLSLAAEELYGKKLVFTDTFRKMISLTVLAWESKEPILIVGETGIGKTKICDVVSSLFKTKLITLSMHRGIESSDFIGNFVFENSKVVWKDGPLVRAMKNGEAFLIDEINLAEDSVLERLNSVLEPQRTLYITETGKEVVAHEGFRILATMNPGGDFGKRELSPALRNRFSEMYFEVSSDEIPLVFDHLIDKRLEEVGMPKESRDMFKSLARSLDTSIRKLELVVDFIYRRYTGRFEEVVCMEMFDAISAWREALEIIEANSSEIETRYIENEKMFGAFPYLVGYKNPSSFDFESKTPTLNLRRVLRAMGLGRGIMLEGDPGIGKTSIVQEIARKMGKKCIRVNLSEQTELCDLIGSYLPIDGEIRFVESELLHSLRNGGWIILDEINLCTQSVIEGLNSVLDYRRKLFIPEVTVDVHRDTRIFATLNPCSSINGRKMLPKSFLDRFVRIKMDGYTADDIAQILHKMFPRPVIVSSASLRENIRANQMGSLESKNINYFIDESIVRIGSAHIQRKGGNLDFVLVHSQLQQMEMIMKCVEMNIPLVISRGVGRDSLLRFVSSVFGQEMMLFNCHKDTDVCDLLGQYQKMENGMFEWRDSAIVQGIKRGMIVVFTGVEFVEKSVFDRLNPLFESERILNIYERGIDTNVVVNPSTRLILLVKEPSMLSPALLDRCMHVELSDRLDYIDLWKLFVRQSNSSSVFHEDFYGLSMDRSQIDFGLDLKRLRLLEVWPSFLGRHLCGVWNALEESRIDEMFQFQRKNIENYEIDFEILHFYNKIRLYVETPDDDVSKINLLKSISTMSSEDRKAVAFIKSADLSIFSRFHDQGGCSLNFPKSSRDLKVKAIRCLRDKKFSDYKKLRMIVEQLPDVEWLLHSDFDMFFFEFIERCLNDPLEMVRKGLIAEMNEFENKSLSEIYGTMKNMYKYGKGSIEKMVDRYEKGIQEYKAKIQEIEGRMNRDYLKFRNSLRGLDFCSYMCGDKALYSEFDDILDYYLIYLFYRWSNGEGCSGMCKIKRIGVDCTKYGDRNSVEEESGDYASYGILCLNLIDRGLEILPLLGKIDCKSLGHEFSRYLNSLYYSRSVDRHSLILEGIIFDRRIHVKEADWIDHLLEFKEKDLNRCLMLVFKVKGRAQIIERETTRLEIEEKLVDLMDQEMLELPIFTSIGYLMEYGRKKVDSEDYEALLQKDISNADSDSDKILESTIVISGHRDKRNSSADKEFGLHSIMEALERFYKDTSVCDIERNYKYFLYLITTPFDFEMAERYFLDCSVYEFVDRIRHAREMAVKNEDPVFYNVTLKYVSFEVESAYEDRIRDAKSKLRKEPKLFRKTLEDLKKFLILPVTNVLNLKFPQPYPLCQGYHPNVCASLLRERSDCECEDWIEFSKKFDRKEVERIFENNKVKKKDVLGRFLNRMPEKMFSNSEVCLGKIVNQMTEDRAIMGLTLACIENPYIPLMYFTFIFGRREEEVSEEETGMKSGTGNVNVSDQIKHEDEIDDEYGEREKVSESDGIDFDNDGSVSTVSESEEEEYESGVDGYNEEESEKDENENEEELKNEQDTEMDVEDEGFGSEKSEDGGEEQLGPDVSEEDTDASNVLDSTESESEGEAKSQNEEDSNFHNEPKTSEYQFKEGILNKNQTCEVADNYDRYVAGNNQEDRALCQGEGNEKISGDEDSGSGDAFESTVRIRIEEEDCTKLTNMLKIIMESRKGSKYKGDFKSGKKLNMKRLVPYIASGFRRDRIWMRRQRNDKKDYILRLFIDNSKSMYNQEMIDTLLSLYSKINKSFSLLGIPVEVYRFGELLERSTVEEMRFSDSQTMIDWIDEFDDGINIILTDGLFQNVGHHHPNFLVLLIDKCNVKRMSKVTVSEGSVFVQRYLDTFPLKYCIISSVDELESTFVMALSELISS